MSYEEIRADDDASDGVQTADERHLSDLLTLLIRVGNQLTAASTVPELCRQAVHRGLAELGFERLSIWLTDNENKLIQGTFGTNENGEVRDERAHVHPWRDHMGEL